MRSAFRSNLADRVVLVRSDDSGLATGRRLVAEGASVFTMVRLVNCVVSKQTLE